jgi:hypothetical protein
VHVKAFWRCGLLCAAMVCTLFVLPTISTAAAASSTSLGVAGPLAVSPDGRLYVADVAHDRIPSGSPTATSPSR